MSELFQVDRKHVLAAMQEHDRLGSTEFMRRYGLRRSPAYTLWNAGQEYDAPAILSVAHLNATGRTADLPDGPGAAGKVLLGLGFDVVVDEELAASAPVRKVAPPRTRPARPEPTVKICPRCFVALPATGVCDFCD
jgi:hypothetical protein